MIKENDLLCFKIKGTAVVFQSIGNHQIAYPESHVVTRHLIEGSLIEVHLRRLALYQYDRMTGRLMYQDITSARELV
jgi:hypothetical protein